MSMMPALGSLVSGLLPLSGFLAVRFIHVLSLSVLCSEIVTRFFLTRNELLAGSISFSKCCLNSLQASNSHVRQSIVSFNSLYHLDLHLPVVLVLQSNNLQQQQQHTMSAIYHLLPVIAACHCTTFRSNDVLVKWQVTFSLGKLPTPSMPDMT